MTRRLNGRVEEREEIDRWSVIVFILRGRTDGVNEGIVSEKSEIREEEE